MKTKLIKTLAVANVLLIAGWLMADVTLHPAPPPHPDAVPDMTHPVPGTDVHPGVMNLAASGSIYDSATACWSFNDTADLGNDDCADTYDLTLVNTPTATGGALGYSMNAVSASAQYATITDNATISIGDGVSWGFAAWVRPTSSVKVFFSKGSNAMEAVGHFDGYYTLGGNLTCRLRDSVDLRSDVTGTVTSGARAFLSCRYNATADELEAGVDATWSGSPFSTSSDGADTGTNMSVGATGEGGTSIDGDIGPVYWYRSASGGDVLTDAITTSLYNSGKGKTCADLTAAEKVNLVSCWDMEEDGGPYVDDIGSNDLTGVNAPTRAAGLVERSDSGMSVRLVKASSQQLTYAGFVMPTSYTITGWVFFEQNATDGLVGAFNATWPNNTQFSIYQSTANTMRHSAGDGSSVDWGQSVSPGGVSWGSLNAWVFVAATFDESDKKAHIRINDAAWDTITTPTGLAGTPYRTAAPLEFSNDGGPLLTTGSYDDWVIWPEVKSDTFIDDLYNAGAGSFYAAYWDAYFSGDPIRFAWSQMPEIRRVQ